MKASEARKKSRAKKRADELSEKAKRDKISAEQTDAAKKDYKKILNLFRTEIAKEVKKGEDTAYIYLPQVGDWRYGEHANWYFCKLRDMLQKQLVTKDGYKLEMNLYDDIKGDGWKATKYKARFIVRWDEEFDE